MTKKSRLFSVSVVCVSRFFVSAFVPIFVDFDSGIGFTFLDFSSFGFRTFVSAASSIGLLDTFFGFCRFGTVLFGSDEL